MNATELTSMETRTRAYRAKALQATIAAASVVSLGTVSSPSHAVDGCLALLCFAAPNWSAIQQCVPPVKQVLSDLAHGKPFPTCNMAGAGNNATHQWSSVPAYCPPQYIATLESDSGSS